MPDEYEITGRYEWERLVRRCRIDPLTKYVGMMLAQYANSDGTQAFPSVATLARVTGLSERRVRTSLTELRALGLIKRVQKGGMRGTQAYPDVHVLTIPADLFERIELLTPSEEIDPKWHTVPVGNGSDEDPNRQDVPPGNGSNRHDSPPNRHVDAAQPARDDIPTGTTCLLPITDQPGDRPRPTDESPFGTEPQEDMAMLFARLAAIDELAARRGA